MASLINADNGVVSGSAGLKSTADTSGVLALQSNGTTGLTLNTSLALGVGSSPSYGTSGQILTSAGSAAPPTWSSPAASAGSFTAVASGTLTTGQTVVLNTDGTVTAVSGTTGSIGSAVSFATGGNYSNAVYDAGSGTIVVAYTVSGSSFLVAGTISGTSISFGTAVGLGINSGVPYALASDASNSKVVVAYTQFNAGVYEAKARVYSISGTTLTAGTAVSYQTSASSNGVSVVSISSGKVVVFSASSSGVSCFRVGTISGTSISFGTAQLVDGTIYCGTRSLSYNTASSAFVCTYTDNGQNAFVILGTVSGTAITLGSSMLLQSAPYVYNSYFASSSVYDAASGNTVLTFGSTLTTSVVVGTVSGTTISLGAFTELPSGGALYVNPAYDTTNARIVYTYNSSTSVVYSFAYISGTSISFSNPVVLASVGATDSYVGATLDTSTSKSVVTYYVSSSTINYAKVFQPDTSNISTKPFVGFSAGAYSGGATATINSVGSTDSNQTGLTVGKAQYVQATGSLGTTASSVATVFAGTSLSATKILVKG